MFVVKAENNGQIETFICVHKDAQYSIEGFYILENKMYIIAIYL